MTRKHFEALARIMRLNAEQAETQEARHIVAGVASDLASYLYQTNPRFDRDRFLAACQPR
jgi:hypothetical protein